MEYKSTDIMGVRVLHSEEISAQEAEFYVNEQLAINPHMKLAKMEIVLDGSEVILHPHYDSIQRLRRITGYLSNLNNFNDAKKAEEAAREKHI